MHTPDLVTSSRLTQHYLTAQVALATMAVTAFVAAFGYGLWQRSTEIPSAKVVMASGNGHIVRMCPNGVPLFRWPNGYITVWDTAHARVLPPDIRPTDFC
jgi:hypothetical protein